MESKEPNTGGKLMYMELSFRHESPGHRVPDRSHVPLCGNTMSYDIAGLLCEDTMLCELTMQRENTKLCGIAMLCEITMQRENNQLCGIAMLSHRPNRSPAAANLDPS